MALFWQEALARAKELDEYRQTTGKVIGPLHGLPISLIDQFHIKGYETCMGYVSRVGKYEKEDSLIVTMLRKAGAILYIKTSVPQGLVTCETENNLIGRTLNSHNAKWTCGGTSGGEGALVGLHGSPLGIGTDYVDVAAGFNSLYGLRPNHGRLPCANMAMSMEGYETVHTVCGPMAHSIEDLRLLVKSTLDGRPWAYDSKLLPLKWNQVEEDDILTKIRTGTLVFAFYDWDEVVMPHPPVLRAMKKAAAVMKQKHTVIEWPPYKHDVGYDLTSKIERVDGYANIRRNIDASGEPLVPQVEELMRLVPKEADINTIWDIQMQKWRYTSSYILQGQTMGESLGQVLDVLVAPIAPTAATLHNQSRYNGYASVMNLNDLPSVPVPVLLADKNIDVKREGYQPVNDLDAMVQADYDPEAYHGSPVAVQIIGRKLSEEVILAVAEEMGRLLRAADSEITSDV